MHHIAGIDKQAWLPHLNELERLHAAITKEEHNGVGPGGVVDLLMDWVLELLTYYNETGDVLDCHWAIGVKGVAKRTLRYEQIFIETALALIPLVPRTLTGAVVILSRSDKLYVVFDFIYSPDELVTAAELRELTSPQFIRPKKIRVRH